MSCDAESLDTIRINLMLDRIDNELKYLDNNPNVKTEERYNELLKFRNQYADELTKTSPSMIDQTIKSTSLSMSSDQIITTKEDLDKAIEEIEILKTSKK